jgi:hypothetical protein
MRLAVLIALGCGGVIGDPSTRAPGESGPNGGSDGSGGPGGGLSGSSGGGAGTGAGTGAGGDTGGAVEPDLPAPEPRFARLTHTQWQRTVRDLLYLSADEPLPDFRPDPLQGGFPFDNDATSLEVDEALFGGYQRAAVDLAERVASDAAQLAKIVPAGWDDPSNGAATFVRAFGERAHRRPLTDAQVGEYVALATMAPGLYPTLAPAEAQVRFLLEAMLQSPYFLYRIEASETVDGEVIPLDDWEIASRLSYALWGTMPDDALRVAAAAGELQAAGTLASHARRMVDDVRIEAAVDDFHRQLLKVDRYREIRPSPAAFPDAPDGLGDLAVTENQMFLRDVFANEGGWREALSATHTFVNDDLAAIYGLSGSFGTNFVRTELDPTERAGVFTQIGFLARNATSVDPDPIHRGVFLAERIACLHIAAPNVMTPPLPATAGRTNREVIEEHTEKPGTICASCHSTLINPFGFPFERYDAVGAHRTLDQGMPIDATASPVIGGAPTPVNGAVELMQAMAAAPAVHTCYLGHWVEYLRGRPEAAEDARITTRLGDLSARGELAIRQALFEIATSRAFVSRSTEELP